MGIYLVMKNSFKRSYNNRILFILMFLLPILIILLGSFVNQIGSSSIRVGILDKGETAAHTQLYQILDHSKGFEYSLAKESTVQTDLITGKYHMVLIFEEGSGIENFELLTYRGLQEIETKELFKTAFTTGVPVDFSKGQEASMTITQRMMAFLLTLLMITSTLNASNMIKDRNAGTLKRYCFAPKTIASYVGGNVTFNILIAVAQLGIAFLLMKLFQLPIDIKKGNLLILSILIVCVASAFGTVISAISYSEMKANITASSITVLLSIIGGTFVPVAQMPELLKTISVISPTRWIIDITQSMEKGIGVLHHSMPYFILIGVTCLLFMVSAVYVKVNKNR